MPTLPWTSGPAPTSTDDDHLVLGSRLVLRRRRDVLGFLVLSMRLHRVAARSAGCVDVTLRARLWRREFWTASRWTDPAALADFVRSPLHRRAMQTYRDRLATSGFANWPTSSRPGWDEVAERVTRAALDADAPNHR